MSSKSEKHAPTPAYPCRVIQEVLSQAVKAEKRSKTIIRRIIRADMDAGEFLDWALKIDDAYKQFMVSALRIHSVKKTDRNSCRKRWRSYSGSRSLDKA